MKSGIASCLLSSLIIIKVWTLFPAPHGYVILLATPTDTNDHFQWTLEKLQAYIIHIKSINPVTTEPANQ